MLTDAVAPAELQLSLEGPRPQRRPTVAFRWILAVPHVLWVWLVGIAAGFAILVTWFAALVLGRVPDGMHTFLSRYVRYTCRVYAYGYYLLSDRYPPFALDADDYPVEALIPPPGRMNRAAVLFRIILLIPVSIVLSLLTYGVGVAIVFIWLIVLITGRPPRSLFEALAAVLRYQLRVAAYGALLTTEYPRGLFGDKGQPEAATPVPAVDEPATSSFLPPTGEPLADLPAQPRITQLVLSTAAKRIVALFLVLGSLLIVGFIAIGIANAGSGNQAADRLQAEHTRLEAAVQEFSTKTQSCGISGGAACVHAADRGFADALTNFRTELRNTSYPRGALPLARQVEDDSTALIDLLHQLEATDDATEYQRLAGRFQGLANRFDQDYQQLIATLRFGR